MYDKKKLNLIRDILIDFDPYPNPSGRILSLYSAVIAIADKSLLESVITLAIKNDISPRHLYEIVLQSYLFVGFPRMIEAADHLNSLVKMEENHSKLTPVSSEESEEWFARGLKLCKNVYGKNYDLLKKRVETFAPDIFRWMVFEGYGKVLSRPELNIIDRELAIISCLTVEQRERQLFSHIIGALNVGTDKNMILQVIEDMKIFSDQGYQMANRILSKLGID